MASPVAELCPTLVRVIPYEDEDADVVAAAALLSPRSAVGGSGTTVPNPAALFTAGADLSPDSDTLPRSLLQLAPLEPSTAPSTTPLSQLAVRLHHQPLHEHSPTSPR
jgi:hypothetical protein